MRGSEGGSIPTTFLSALFFCFFDVYVWFSHSIAIQLGSAMRPWGQKSFGACSPRCVIGWGRICLGWTMGKNQDSEGDR